MGFCLSTSMNEYPDVTHLSCINCCIQGHSVHKQNPIYWNNCLHNQVQCPSLLSHKCNAREVIPHIYMTKYGED